MHGLGGRAAKEWKDETRSEQVSTHLIKLYYVILIRETERKICTGTVTLVSHAVGRLHESRTAPLTSDEVGPT